MNQLNRNIFRFAVRYGFNNIHTNLIANIIGLSFPFCFFNYLLRPTCQSVPAIYAETRKVKEYVTLPRLSWRNHYCHQWPLSNCVLLLCTLYRLKMHAPSTTALQKCFLFLSMRRPPCWIGYLHLTFKVWHWETPMIIMKA